MLTPTILEKNDKNTSNTTQKHITEKTSKLRNRLEEKETGQHTKTEQEKLKAMRTQARVLWKKCSEILHRKKKTVKLPEVKPVRTPVAIFGSLGVCIYVPASRHWLISYSPIHLT